MIEKEIQGIWKRKFTEGLMETLAYTKLMEIRLIEPQAIMAVDNYDIKAGDEIDISKSEIVVGGMRMEIQGEKGVYKCIKKEYGHIFLVKK